MPWYGEKADATSFECPFCLVDCLCHQYQLIVKGGLQQANDVLESWGCGVGYVASLSKIMLLWRDNARTIFTVWQTLFGPQAAWSSARKVPPKCIPGRWGSISLCESFLLSCVWQQLVEVFNEVFNNTTKPKSIRKKPAAADNDKRDEGNRLGYVGSEDMKAYSEK